MRPFNDTLREMAGGRTHQEMTEKLAEIVEAVMLTHRAGKLTLEITVKPNGDHAVTLSDKVKATVPEGSRGDSVFFVKDGSLQRNDPRQTEMNLRRVEEPKTTRVVPEPEVQHEAAKTLETANAG